VLDVSSTNCKLGLTIVGFVDNMMFFDMLLIDAFGRQTLFRQMLFQQILFQLKFTSTDMLLCFTLTFTRG